MHDDSTSFAWGILIYFLIVLGIIWIGCKSGMGLFSALTLGALIGGIFLLFMIPPSDIERQIKRYCRGDSRRHCNDSIVIFYGVIMTLTLILLTCFVILKAFEDRARRLKYFDDCHSLFLDEYVSL